MAAALFAPAQADSHCPASAPSVRLQRVGSLKTVPVSVNGTGPYDFLVDTGSQITVVDPTLAAKLHLSIQGETGVVGVGVRTTAVFTQVDLLEVGSHAVAKPFVVVQDTTHLSAAGRRVVGMLGGNFLGHFDVLIDYGHGVLCLDAPKHMDTLIRGERIALISPPHPEDEVLFTKPLLIPVHLSGIPGQLLLLLDSGTDVPFLYDAGMTLARPWLVGNP